MRHLIARLICKLAGHDPEPSTLRIRQRRVIARCHRCGHTIAITEPGHAGRATHA